MADLRNNAAVSNLVRLVLKDKTTGQGKTGLSGSTTGLIISTICDNEATAVAYTQAGGTIQTIATLGTYAAPSASNCRFKEVDSTNHKGLYEFQFADARYAVANAKRLVISVNDAESTILDGDYEVDLQGVAANAALAAALFTTQLAESYAADGVAPTPAQALFLIQQALTEFAISGTTKTIKKLNGTTTAATETLDSATTPTSITRAT